MFLKVLIVRIFTRLQRPLDQAQAHLHMRYAHLIKRFAHDAEPEGRIKVFCGALRTQANFFVATATRF
jgi:hypothetical protein